jgi:hypothetical protein
MIIAKYNPSGIIQWQRRLKTSAFDSALSIAIDSSNSICVTGTTTVSGSSRTLIARLPNDGTLTGTYSLGGFSFTYEASDLTDSSWDANSSTTSLTETSTSLTETTTTLADSATTLTSVTVAI